MLPPAIAANRMPTCSLPPSARSEVAAIDVSSCPKPMLSINITVRTATTPAEASAFRGTVPAVLEFSPAAAR